MITKAQAMKATGFTDCKITKHNGEYKVVEQIKLSQEQALNQAGVYHAYVAGSTEWLNEEGEII